MAEYPTTDNHGFARIEPGTLEDEWGDIVNNALVDLLEERVVLVDRNANRTEYDAYEDALFVASDSSDVYVGTGTDWDHLGALTGDGGASGGVQYAAPGEVQSVIDDVANPSEGRATVLLHAQTDYDPASTWNVKRGVNLVFNGARVRLSSDIDVLHLEPGSQVFEPQLYLRDVADYSSNAITLDAAQYGKYDEGQAPKFDSADEATFHSARVVGGHTQGTIGDGTGIKLFADSSVDPDGHVYFARFESHQIHDIGIGVEIESVGSNFINSNYFHGVTVAHPEKGVYYHGDGNIQDNRMTDFIIQPTEPETQYGIHMACGSHTYFDGIIWDKGVSLPSRDRSIVLEEGAGPENTFVDNFKIEDGDLTDNSGAPSNNFFCMDRFVFDGSHGIKFYDSDNYPSSVLSQDDDTLRIDAPEGGILDFDSDGTATYWAGDYFEMSDAAKLSPLGSEPAAENGVIAYANGSGWDPGSGTGLYCYEEGSWVKL